MSDRANDVEVLAAWWTAHAHEVGDQVRGLWFGLFIKVELDDSQRFTMYVAGTPDFDPDDNGDWACEYVWWPLDRYLALDGLAAIKLDDWQDAVDHGVAIVTEVAPWETAPPGVLGAGVGFDSGDMHVVWTRA